MITDGDEIENSTENNGIMHEIDETEEDSNLTRLTEMVRRHYLNYLEKQLLENLKNYNYNRNNNTYEDYDEMCKQSIKKTAELLEDKAVKACMISKFYQRTMVKIIAIVRRTTEENRLLNDLEKCIQTKDEIKVMTSCKETQTEAICLKEFFVSKEEVSQNENFNTNHLEKHVDDNNIMSLDEKIEIFQKHLHKENRIDIAKNNNQKISKHQQKCYKETRSCRRLYRHRAERHKILNKEVYFSPTPSSVPEPTSPITPTSHNSNQPPKESKVMEDENSNDSVAIELARLFSEEKTELDEIFGIDPNQSPDDPQICKILKEIEESKILSTKNSVKPTTSTSTQNKFENQTERFTEVNKVHKHQYIKSNISIDLSKSIWPCELFRQRRKLSESLARLIEEDLRWHDVIKWKFSELFGEDSDDEFTHCSPTIELNEILIGSCVRRISPWVVEYLMKPMRDGLIGNRFLFKKLAKNIARSIIMENQYPDELTIKECVENFFCLHQAVMSIEDLEFNIPSISLSF